MPSSIRSRLLLLVLSVLVPAVAAAAWIVTSAYRAANEALERALADTTRSLALLVDRELTERATVARVLASSLALDAQGTLAPEQVRTFEQQARRALRERSGWAVLAAADADVVDTRLAAGAKPPARAPARLLDDPRVAGLQGDGAALHVSVVQPVQHEGRTLYNVVITLLPQELQRLLDEQAQTLPPGWSGTVVDPRGRVVARIGSAVAAGTPLPPPLLDAFAADGEGAFEAELGNDALEGWYRTSSDGWRFVTATPRQRGAGMLPRPVLELALASALLLGAAVASALLAARSIAQPVKSLKAAAARLQAGMPVPYQATGMPETDGVATAIAEAAEAMLHRRHDLERQVAEAVAQARESEQRLSQSQRVEALGRLTGGVAHDFNNLLGVISNSAHLVERRAAANPDVRAPLATLLRAVEAGSQLTRHLLRFAGRHPSRPARLALDGWLPEVVELVKVVLGRRIEVALHVAPGTRPIHVDAGELELALINLAQNARDALPGGGHVWIDARNAAAADVAGLPAGDYVAITVSDDGSGVDESIVGRVFEPFFTTKHEQRRSGLGLSQVHGFATQALGQVKLASTRGLGTSVTLVVPAAGAVATGAESAPAPPAAGARDDRMRGRRVLLVEDNDELAGVTAVLLSSYGCNVDVVRGPAEALRVFERGERYDVVLSDVVMPGDMDGVRLARHLRREMPELPIVLISGYSSALASAHDFIVLHKPCTPEQLVGALADAIAGTPVQAGAPPSPGPASPSLRPPPAPPASTAPSPS